MKAIYCSLIMYLMTLTARAQIVDVSISPSSLSFGPTQVNATRTMTIRLINYGSTPFSGNAVIADGAYYAVTAGASYYIIAGASHDVSISFKPLAIGSFYGSVTFTGGYGLSAPLSGSGYSSDPIIDVSPTSVDFGTVNVGQSATQSFVVKNVNLGTLTGNASVQSPFRIVGGTNYAISAGQSTNVFVAYTPVESNAAHSVAVFFTGGGGASRKAVGNSYSGMTLMPSGGDPYATNWVVISNRFIRNYYPGGHVTVLDTSSSMMLPYNLRIMGYTNYYAAESNVYLFSYANLSAWYIPDLDTLTTYIFPNRSQYVGLGRVWSSTWVLPFTYPGSYWTIDLSTGDQQERSWDYVNWYAPYKIFLPSSRPSGMRIQTGVFRDKTPIGTVASLDVKFQNIGSSTKTGTITLDDQFAVVGGSSYVLPGGASKTIRIAFTPTEVGVFTNRITFTDGVTTSVTIVATSYYPRYGEVIDDKLLAPKDMVLVPYGTFFMGNNTNIYTKDIRPDESPLRSVYLSSYYIDKYEVSKVKWDSVIQWATNNGYAFSQLAGFKGPDHPVFVTWLDAVKWCNARSQMENLDPCYFYQGVVFKSGTNTNIECRWENRGYRLPSEAEWEKAARGGTDIGRFPWTVGSDVVTHSNANYQGTTNAAYDLSIGFNPAFANGGYPYTSPAGSFAPNRIGIYDLGGNMQEWVWDWYSSSYQSNDVVNPAGPLSGTAKVLRGGCWYSGGLSLRVSFREKTDPLRYDHGLGFRCARSLSREQDYDADGIADISEIGYERYQIIVTNLTWEAAKLDAEARGGHLATITSVDEWEAMKRVLGTNNLAARRYWLGATDVDEEGSWKWITGETWSHQNWRPGEPNNSREGQHYLKIYEDGGWDDEFSYRTFSYILEKGFYTYPTLADSDGDGLNDGYEYGVGRYEIVYTNMSWHQARSDAESRGGHLATITSLDEWLAIKQVIGETNFMGASTWIWIGASDHLHEGDWQWVTGETWGYSRWTVGQPDGGTGGNYAHIWDYRILDGDFNWNDRGGGSTPAYLLERGYFTSPVIADSDGDGITDYAESKAGTDPNDGDAHYSMKDMQMNADEICLMLQSGVGVTSIVERTETLNDPQWKPVFTSTPSLLLTNCIPLGVTADGGYYRIRLKQ